MSGRVDGSDEASAEWLAAVLRVPAPDVEAAPVDPAIGCDEARARVAAAAIATLHAGTWCEPGWLRYPGLTASLPDSAAATALGETARRAAGEVVERFGATMAAADRRTLGDAMDMVTSWVSAVHGRYSLLHGDCRGDRVLFSADGSSAFVVGTRTLAVGLPARDLACFAGTMLTPDRRSSVDHDLVTEYHAALRHHGVTGYDLETCWYDYCYAMVQAPLTCALALAGDDSDDREQAVLLETLHRGCAAVRDLDTLRLVSAVAEAEAAAARFLTHVNVH